MKNKSIFAIIITLFYLSNLNAQANQESEKLKSRIDTFLTKAVSNGFNGALLVAKGREIIISKGYGMADKEKNIPNTPNTVFDIGSVTKQFTGTAILKLVQLKKLKITDRLSTFFKNLPDDKKDITVHQLLTHSAGIVDLIEEYSADYDFNPIPRAVFFEKLFATKLLHEPGFKHEYSNAGYSILARVIELVSGQDYESFLSDYLFKPSGMAQTGYLLPQWDSNLFAKGYRYNVLNIGSMAERYRKEGRVSWNLKGNGGINSTIEDMFKWYKALKENKILPKSLMEKLTTPYITEDEEGTTHYAYGWAIFKSSRNTKIVTHNGGNGTFFHDYLWFPKEDVVIIYSTNTLTREVDDGAWRVEKMVFDSASEPKAIEKSVYTLLFRYVHNYNGNIDKLAVKIRQKFGKDFPHSGPLNKLGLYYLREGKDLTKAIVLFKLNLELFSDSAYIGKLWYHLAEAYFENNQQELAKNSYKKALELKHATNCFWCENTSKRLKKLETKE